MTKRRRNGFITGLILAALAAGATPAVGQAARATSATGIAIDGKGRIVVAGAANGSIALARYKADGTLDRSFGHNGRVTSGLARPIRPGGRTVAIDSAGRIVVAGDGKSGFAAVRFKANGAVNRSFGKNGLATRKVPSGSESHANAIAIGTNGKIVVAGYGCGNADGSDTCFALTRFNPNGTVDKTFGSGGLVTTSVGLQSQAYSVIVAPSGETFAGGFGDGGDPQAPGFALVRYDGKGNAQKTIVTQFPGAVGVPTAQAVGFDPTGNVFAAGSSDGSNFALARYDFDDLNIDPALGGTGTPTTELTGPATANAIAVDISGRPVLAGLGHSQFALARYTPAGFLDQGFGSDGLVFTNFGKGTDYARGVVTDFTKHVVAVGTAGAAGADGLGTAFAIARYTTNGTLDKSFGSSGRVTTHFPRPHR